MGLRRRRVAAIALAALLPLTACSPDAGEQLASPPSEGGPTASAPPSPGQADPTPTPTDHGLGPSPSPSPSSSSPSPSPDAPSTPASSPAPGPSDAQRLLSPAGTVLEFFRIWDAISSDPEADFQPLADLTRGNVRELVDRDVSQLREQGVVQTGQGDYRVLRVRELSPSDDGDPRTEVAVCSSNPDVDFVDIRTGKSVLTDSQDFHVRWEFEVTYVDDFHWVLSSASAEASDTCP